MKKHPVLYFVCFCCIWIVCASCEHKEAIRLGSIYGIVSDKATGEPVKSVGVELLPVGIKAITGEDGKFEFPEIETGTYNLLTTKSGYKEHRTNDIVVKGNDENVPVDILIEKLPPTLQVVDDEGNEITSIDFGEAEGDEMKSFNIFNNSEEPLEWEIAFRSEWISSFSKQEGILKAGATQTIVITIDRAKLVDGINTTIVHIVSNNGSKQINITATSVCFIETLEVSDVNPTSAVLNGKLNKKGISPISEYGFVYGLMPTPSLDNGAAKVVVKGTAQVGIFSYAIGELVENETYFFGAFAVVNDKEYYGTSHSFVAQEVQYVTLLPANIMVQKMDLGLGYVDWSSADVMSKSSIVGGFTDWRLPTIDELMILFNEQNHIGGFHGGCYWSDSEKDSGYHYCVNFSSGNMGVMCNYDKCYVRAVRTVK